MYLTAIPRSAVTHIQNSAPGPPQWMAIATPAMLPMPTVAESAVVSAWKCETSPGSAGSSYLPLVTPKPCARWRNWMKPRRRVRKTPVPKSAMTMKGMRSSPTEMPDPQTTDSSQLMTCATVSMGTLRGSQVDDGLRRPRADAGF